MTNQKLLILKDEIKVNDKYQKMYTVDIFGEMNEYENVRFISTQDDNKRIHFVYSEFQRNHSFIVGNTLAFVSKLEALRLSSSMLGDKFYEALYLYLDEKGKANG